MGRPIMASGEGGGSTESSVSVGLEKEDEVERVFRRFDANGDGKISASELGEVVRALGSEVTPEEVDMMMAEMDSDRDGFVDLKEFADFHRSGRGCAGGASSGGVDELRDAFEMYDLDKNGLISARELHMVLKQLGEKCSLHDCSRMISSVDGDGDGCVSFEEFKRMMTNKGGAALASPSTH